MIKQLIICLFVLISWFSNLPVYSQKSSPANIQEVTFEYAPKWWQSTIGLPDDAVKTIVGKDGEFYFDFASKWTKGTLLGPFLEFNTRIAFINPVAEHWKGQNLMEPKIPIIETVHENNELSVVQTTFTVAPPVFNQNFGPPAYVCRNNGKAI